MGVLPLPGPSGDASGRGLQYPRGDRLSQDPKGHLPAHRCPGICIPAAVTELALGLTGRRESGVCGDPRLFGGGLGRLRGWPGKAGPGRRFAGAGLWDWSRGFPSPGRIWLQGHLGWSLGGGRQTSGLARRLGPGTSWVGRDLGSKGGKFARRRLGSPWSIGPGGDPGTPGVALGWAGGPWAGWDPRGTGVFGAGANYFTRAGDPRGQPPGVPIPTLWGAPRGESALFWALLRFGDTGQGGPPLGIPLGPFGGPGPEFPWGGPLWNLFLGPLGEGSHFGGPRG